MLLLPPLTPVTSITSPSLMPLLLLYPETLGNGCSWFKSPSLLSHLPPTYHRGFHIKSIHQRIQTTCSRTSPYHRCNYCHYCNVEFALFQNVTHYTNSPSSSIHVNTTDLLTYHVRIGCQKHDIREVRVHNLSLHYVTSRGQGACHLPLAVRHKARGTPQDP